MSTIPQTTLGDDHRERLSEALAELATALGSRVYSPRIKCLSIEQVCDVTGLKKSALYEMVKRDEFPKPQDGFKVNRWRESAIIAWMDRNDPNLRDGKKG